MTLGSVADGLSNTIYASEVVISAVYNGSGDNLSIKGNIATGITLDMRNDVPETCRAVKSGSEIAGPGHSGRIGLRWCDGLNSHTAFFTILPPNNANCTIAATYDENVSLISASSNHTGGVNVGFCDGSVHFVSDTVDCGYLTKVPPNADGQPDTSKRYMDYTGKSYYGVWGASGTAAGGESIGVL